ncbi:MAG: alpha/beta hydrolase [Prolixibacteraceae bacterium]|nr:alpha/beta hydrolase [Prolixibacteraceae bacterium]
MNFPTLQITGSGQPFIWLHGMLGSVESDSVYSMVDFNRVSEIASVIRYDACGKSVTGDYSWDGMTDELLHLVNHYKFEPKILGGTSMGSGTAIHFAVRYPERVKALILVTPPPAWEKRKIVKALYNKIASKADHSGNPEFMRKLISMNPDVPDFFEQENPGTWERLLEFRLGFEQQYYPQIYRGGAASDLPAPEEIEKIKIPTLIAAFPDDLNHPLEIAQTLNNLITGSEIVIISNYADYRKFQEKVNNLVGSTFSDNKS